MEISTIFNIDISTIIYYALSIIYAILVIRTILVVVSENGNPIRTLAWVLVLVFIPALGLIFFYFFGQGRKLKRLAYKYYKRVKKFEFESFKAESGLEVVPQYSSLAKFLGNDKRSSLIEGSDVEVITKGPRKFQALLDDIKNAKHHIHMEYFIFNSDETGTKVKEALMQKAAEGVEVRFLYDNVANWMVPKKFYEEMKQGGVMVTSFMNLKLPAFRSKVNYRNHRKVVVIDGNIGYIGGMNIANDYATDPNWRDTHLRIVGSGVNGLQASFLLDWSTGGEPLIDSPVYFPTCPKTSKNLLQIAAGGPLNPYRNILQATSMLIMSARKYVYIQTPYFLPTESLCQAIQSAALGGVDVRLMVSKKSDSAYVDPAAHSYYEDLMQAGLKIYELQGKFIHAKTMVTDDLVSVIGSANMDFRSLETNFEINCYMYDPEIAVTNREIFLEDMKGCKQLVLEEWQKRSKWKKLIESVMRMFAPQL